MVYYVALPFCLVFSLIFCFNRGKGFSVKNLMLKCISSLCFILTAVFALIANQNSIVYGALIIFGSVLGLLGDIVLDLKGIYEADKNTYMKSGFIFFLFGHIFYSAAIIYSSGIKLWAILLCVLFSVVFSVLNILSAKITKVEFGDYKRIVFIYSVFLAMTMSLSFAAALSSGFAKSYVLLLIGSVLFTLSDAILSMTYFGKNKDTFAYYFLNHLCYYAAQYLIVSSILFIK